MFPRLSCAIRTPLSKTASPHTVKRRMLQSSAPYTSTTQFQADHSNLVGLPYPELVAFTRGFLTETGYRMPEHRTTAIAQSLIDAFALHEDDHKLRFMHSLSSLVNDITPTPAVITADAASLDWPNRSVVFEADYSVDQLLLDSLPTIKRC